MRTLDELLADVPALASLEPGYRTLIAGCAQNRTFEEGASILRAGDSADRFYVVRTGTVALETFVPQRGALTIETLHDGDVVGWSWLFPPYRVQFDARAQGTVHTIEIDGACLRGKCEADPALGYALMRSFAAVVVDRLQATRVRLLDVYAPVPGS